MKGQGIDEDSSILYAKELTTKQLQNMGIDVLKCEESFATQYVSSLLSTNS